VQQVTFDSYLYKTVQGNNPVGDVMLLGKTVSSLWANNFGPKRKMQTLV
jgi:geranylgeranyl reductase